jgi:hypothetical protein
VLLDIEVVLRLDKDNEAASEELRELRGLLQKEEETSKVCPITPPLRG